MRPSLCVYIYMNLTHTSRDPGWLNWGFIIKYLVFTIGALVATQETCANVFFPEHENIDRLITKLYNLFDGMLTILYKKEPAL